MNSKTKTTLIIIACVLAVALIAWLIWKMLHQNDETSTVEMDKQLGNVTFPLKQGSKGQEVKELQYYLNDKISEMQQDGVKAQLIATDGIFGPETASACNLVFGKEYVTEAEFNEF